MQIKKYGQLLHNVPTEEHESFDSEKKNNIYKGNATLYDLTANYTFKISFSLI